MTTTKKTFAEKIAESEKTDSDSSIEKGVIPKGIELVKEKPEKKARNPRQKKVKVEDNDVLVDEETGGSIPEVKKKVKRAPSAYNLFVKEAYKRSEVQKLPPKDRFSKVASLWQKEKAKKSK